MKILYLEGDPNSPKYVEGALRYLGLRPTTRLTKDGVGDVRGHDVYLLSDAAAKDLGDAAMRRIAQTVREGAGLLVAGGWTSLGRGGYAGSPLADVLPVRVRRGDDRVNVPSGLFLSPNEPRFWKGLPFRPPPVITGYNRVTPTKTARVVLNAHAVRGVRGSQARLDKTPVPIMVFASPAEPRVAVLATDPAPHWSGGWTDWGRRAINVGNAEELGDHYVEFWRRLIGWVGRQSPEPRYR